MNHAAQWYEIQNLENSICPLTSGLNELYRNCSFQQELMIPASLGDGYWRRIRINQAMEIVICNMRFNMDMCMSSTEQDAWMKLCFCLGEGLQWTTKGRPIEYKIAQDEVSAFGRIHTNSKCNFYSNRRFQSVTLKLDVTRKSHVLHSCYMDKLMSEISTEARLYYNSKTTPSMKRIIYDIIHCKYRGEVKKIYLEGKILELVAVYLDESVSEKGALTAGITLTKSDIASLNQAKQIVDGNLVSPPSLAELSRMIYLNETKLKKGFKQLFGMPVHTYIIDQRLEMAYQLLEARGITITSAAYMAGFSNAAQFAGKFRKKYGVNPSVYFK